MPRALSASGQLAVVMPCYNEQETIEEIVAEVLKSDLVGELVIVDDASTDATLRSIDGFDDPRIRVLRQDVNQGKGAALRRGFAATTLPYVIVQDADLEYDPAEYEAMMRPMLEDGADVVFGSRFRTATERRVLYFWHTVGNRFLTLLSNATTNLNLTDMETCYKLFRREILEQIEIEEDRFGVEPELTAKIAGLKCRVFEVGISYHGRTYAEGKKIGWRDGVRAIFCILAYSGLGRRVRLQRLGPAVGWVTGSRA